MTTTKKLLFIPLAVVVLTVLRETQVLNLNFYSSYANSWSSSTINTNSSLVSWGKTEPLPAFQHTDLSIVILLGKDTLYKEINRLLPIIVKVDNFHTGPLWTPLYKSASFSAVGLPSFDPRQKLKGEYPLWRYKIGMSGHLSVRGDIVIKGICSNRQARQLVIDKIIESFTSEVKKQFSMQSPELFQVMAKSNISQS